MVTEYDIWRLNPTDSRAFIEALLNPPGAQRCEPAPQPLPATSNAREDPMTVKLLAVLQALTLAPIMPSQGCEYCSRPWIPAGCVVRPGSTRRRGHARGRSRRSRCRGGAGGRRWSPRRGRRTGQSWRSGQSSRRPLSSACEQLGL